MSISKSKRPEAFLACIKERIRLNPGSKKETYHIVLDLKGSEIEYSVGDAIGIHPENDASYVKQLVEAHGDPTLHDFFLKHANLHRIPKKILGTHPNFLTLLKQEKISKADLEEKLLPLLPRYYSIASSQKQVGEEVHLTVTLAPNPPDCPVPFGTCSHYLCHRAPLFKPLIPIFLQPSRHFRLPAESHNHPIIMIGPGTGVAPFRGFMQERTCSKNWLFFGERCQKTDFYYRPFWETLVEKKHLKLDYAFSRDQTEKQYVQHKLLENRTELWKWIQEGAYIFVCGDASKMAKDVDQTLCSIAQTEGGLSNEESRAYIKELRKTKKYLRDVY